MIQLLFFTKQIKIKVENVDFYVCSLWKSASENVGLTWMASLVSEKFNTTL